MWELFEKGLSQHEAQPLIISQVPNSLDSFLRKNFEKTRKKFGISQKNLYRVIKILFVHYRQTKIIIRAISAESIR